MFFYPVGVLAFVPGVASSHGKPNGCQRKGMPLKVEETHLLTQSSNTHTHTLWINDSHCMLLAKVVFFVCVFFSL